MVALLRCTPFEHMAVADIRSTDVAAWEKRARAAGYAHATVKNLRATLHLILSDAVDEGLRESNPASKRRGAADALGAPGSAGRKGLSQTPSAC